MTANTCYVWLPFAGLSVWPGIVVGVPLTFPAHQAVVLPLKIWKPRWFDGIALVVGAGSPDLFNALSSVDTFQSHHPDGMVVAVVFTVVYSILLRRFAVDGLFGTLPNLGPLRAKRFRVLKNGRPRLLVTTLSAFIGVASHVFVDSFTHAGRFGSNLLGINDILFEVPVFGGMSGARVLQYLGHTIGSLIGVLLFVLVVSKRHLGDWYGEDQIRAARNAPVRPGSRRRLYFIIGLGLAAGMAWGAPDRIIPVFHMGLAFVIALLIAGIVNRPTTVEPCPDTFTHRTTTSSTLFVERSPKISHRSAT